MDKLIEQLLRAGLLQEGGEVTDGQLLESFVTDRNAAALELLVRRHAPMVWGVCHRILHDPHDLEDAFQATFLVLVRKAGSVWPREMVGNWLYGVARQTALKARATAARLRSREKQVASLPQPTAPDQGGDDSHLRAVLDQELSHLPDKYRAAIVLCDLEEKTRSEAARQLGVPEGTLAARVARGRELLARRLVRHGVALSSPALAGVLTQQTASACVPATVLSSTIKAETLVSAGQATVSGLISTKAAALIEGVIKSMMLAKIKTVVLLTALVLCVCGVTGAVAGLVRDGNEPAKNLPRPPVAEKKAVPAPKNDGKLAETRAKLLKERVVLATKGYNAAKEGLTHTRRINNILLPVAYPDEVLRWSLYLLQAERDLSPRRAGQIAALEAHLKRLTELKAQVETLAVDFLPRRSVWEVEIHRLQAELWLVEAKGK